MLLYSRSFDAEETCNLGCMHKVTYNEIVEVTEVHTWSHPIYYGEQQCGIGTRFWYADSNGMIYMRDTDWSGLTHLRDENDRVWESRPVGVMVNKDLDGNVIGRSR